MIDEPTLTKSLSPFQRGRLLAVFILAGVLPMKGMDIVWTKMAGQWPVEASPVVLSQGSHQQILVLNRGGQLLLLGPDGAAIGPGQDGLVAQLPPGRWTTAPTVFAEPS